ncbi:hypothetical protein RDWZM_009147 [Blomia tropicalis]|uniref:Protein AAR2 homolog n=1 Tax=Blomia tropicalis TaxID=40697 RepID=A0A9Q0RL19_BLOTA|nr:hypothetical protein RDWZM_009147 [Blomia tropicalis]
MAKTNVNEIIHIPMNNEISQQTAKFLVKNCGTLIIHNFPIGSEFGIDLSIHYTGEKFMGMKMIPPGLHFIYYSLVDKEQHSTAPRSGFFHNFTQGEILVCRWDPAAEDISTNLEDSPLIERLKSSFVNGQLDSQLGAYQFDQYQTWVSLTDYISYELLAKINPICGRIYSASSLVYKPEKDGTIIPRVDKDGLPEMIISPEATIRFQCETPKRFLYPLNATPDEITKHSMDSTFTLESILQLPAFANNEGNLLGEFQFAFISFLLGHTFEAFEYWRDILRIICCSREALSNKHELFLSFIRVVYFQLKQTNEAIFADIVENENQVFLYIRTFILNLRDSVELNINRELVKRGEKFAQSLQKDMEWNFDYEPDNELPVIVETE